MYRFWYDTKDQKHRHELYNLKDDIGEKNNLADKNPEQLQTMIKAMEDYYKNSGVIGYNPNANYKKQAVGTWFPANTNGTLSAKDGFMRINADKPGFTVTSRFMANVDKTGFVSIEARSESGSILHVSSGKKNKHPITLKKEWQTYIVSLKTLFTKPRGNKLFLTLTKAGKIEVRNIRILAADKTEMMKFFFY